MEHSWSTRVQQLQALLQAEDTVRNPSNLSTCAVDDMCEQIDVALLRHWMRPSLTSSQISSLTLKPTDFATTGHLGQGQFGVVNAAVCHLNGRVYAIKCIPKLVAIRAQIDHRVERQIHLLADRHAPPLFAAFHTPATLFLVVEYAPCGSLWDRIVNGSNTDRTSALSPEETLWWTSRMAAAITWLHQIGFAHRDVKPENFLLYPDNNLKITDFGSAAPLLRDGTVAPMSCHCLTGTPDYIAPEVLRHAELFTAHGSGSLYTKAVDWWSLGVTVYELAAGAPPFFSHSISATYSSILRADYDISSVPDQVKPIVEALLMPSEIRASSVDLPTARPPRPPAPTITPISERSMFAEYSPGITTQSSSEDYTIVENGATLSLQPLQERWIGWTWLPIDARPVSPPCTPHQTVTPSAPKSTFRRRPHAAYDEMVTCVSKSAEKLSTYQTTKRVSELERKHRILDLRLRALSAALAGLSSRIT